MARDWRLPWPASCRCGQVTPFVEMWTETKLPGVVTGAQRSFEGYPPELEWGGLMADFARESVRPH